MTKSKVLLISNISALIIVLIETWMAVQFAQTPQDDMARFFGVVFLLFLIPSILFILTGLILGLLAYRKNNRWLTLVSSISYLLGTLVLFNFGVIMVPTLILSFTAFGTQVNQVRKAKIAAAEMLP